MARRTDEFTAREIGARIAEARRERGLTQEQLATMASFSKRSLQDYETGVSVPYRHLRELNSLLGRPVDWFLHGDQRSALVGGDRLDRFEEKLEQVFRAVQDLKPLRSSPNSSPH
jgi:transcriptional regulator with XRE-family HTH domain